jgi:hypothetical protein
MIRRGLVAAALVAATSFGWWAVQVHNEHTNEPPACAKGQLAQAHIPSESCLLLIGNWCEAHRPSLMESDCLDQVIAGDVVGSTDGGHH